MEMLTIMSMLLIICLIAEKINQLDNQQDKGESDNGQDE